MALLPTCFIYHHSIFSRDYRILSCISSLIIMIYMKWPVAACYLIIILVDLLQDSRGITHTNGNNKTSVAITWTAPPRGTGTVQIRFAVVQMRVTYWADQLAAESMYSYKLCVINACRHDTYSYTHACTTQNILQWQYVNACT